jgi:hypothetical protein
VTVGGVRTGAPRLFDGFLFVLVVTPARAAPCAKGAERKDPAPSVVVVDRGAEDVEVADVDAGRLSGGRAYASA